MLGVMRYELFGDRRVETACNPSVSSVCSCAILLFKIFEQKEAKDVKGKDRGAVL